MWVKNYFTLCKFFNSGEPYRVVLSAECTEQINHPKKKGMACRDYFARVLKITN